jgi:hypothetical protein
VRWHTPAMKQLLRPLLLAAFLVGVMAAPAQAKIVHFTSPSGNIDCLGFTDGTVFVQCLVQKADWPRRPSRPASCDLDFSPTEIQLSNRKVTVGACRGDIGPLCLPSGGDRCTVLGYGRAVDIGGIRCTSATTGVTCRYKRAKRPGGPRAGFRVSRQNYTILR